MFYFKKQLGGIKMTELIKSYLAAAAMVRNRITELTQQMKEEKDADKLKLLRIRRDILQDERYEMLGVVSEMIHRNIEIEKASGDC